MCPATSSNPIKSVWQSAKRMRPPDVLTPEEITALLEKLPEPLRTACELHAFTGLRRGELIGLQWQDVDFENLVIHVRRSVVMMVAGAPKTEASAKDVPLDAALAESLLKLKLTGPYDRETDWVFVSVTMNGKQPLRPETLWRRHGRPAVKAAGITKRVAFHTFRHTYTTLLTQNNEDVKVARSCYGTQTAESLSTFTLRRVCQKSGKLRADLWNEYFGRERQRSNWTKVDHD
jgi:integrase